MPILYRRDQEVQKVKRVVSGLSVTWRGLGARWNGVYSLSLLAVVQLFAGIEKPSAIETHLFFFSDFGIETVRAPPLRATETAVT